MTDLTTGNFPRFFTVGSDDVVVKISLDPASGEVFGTVVRTGFPYPPAKVFLDGSEISESEATRLVKEAEELDKHDLN